MNGVARTALWLALSVLGIGAIGLIDHASGTEYRIFPLYYLPVSLGAWYAGRSAAVALAAISSIVWVAVNATVAETGDPMVVAVNFTILVVAATGVGLLVAVLRQRLDAEHDLGRIDSLTGLPNHRAFHERGELLLAYARRPVRAADDRPAGKSRPGA